MDLLLYSKHSKHCVDLLNTLNINNIECFTKVCIDDPRARTQILNSKKSRYGKFRVY